MSGDPERIGEAVAHVLARLGPAAAIAETVAAWPRAVGPGIAANAWPARLGRDGTLHVNVSSSAWAFELSHLEAGVRERLREWLGVDAPRRLRFAVGPLPERGGDRVREARREVPKVSITALAAGERIAASIEDPDLRSLVARAAAVSLARFSGEATDR
ncbi:MAG: DUF721 domain-containing protein [Actinomycetota bacterium]|nr:DUF721 domain-containing protein [Actinomycetota bacterium]